MRGWSLRLLSPSLRSSFLFEGLGLDSPEELFPEWIRPYVKIDVEGFARDLELNGDVISAEAPDGTVWVFDGDA